MATTLRYPLSGRIAVTTPETFFPDSLGWDVSALPAPTSISATGDLAAPDVNDPALTLREEVQYTIDPTGQTGWDTLVGVGWIGGPQGKAQVASQPSLGPYNPSRWPALKRLRVRNVPSRAVNVAWTLTYS